MSIVNCHCLREEVSTARRVVTYGAAPNALFFVSDLIAENVFVITATNRLMSQKFKTIIQMIKKKHEMKNSESIMSYIIGDHCKAS